MKPVAKYIVGRYLGKVENFLGYAIREEPACGYLWAGVLQGSVVRGGPDWKNGPVTIQASEVRPATAEDFATYRASIPPDFYEKNDKKVL